MFSALSSIVLMVHMYVMCNVDCADPVETILRLFKFNIQHDIWRIIKENLTPRVQYHHEPPPLRQYNVARPQTD